MARLAALVLRDVGVRHPCPGRSPGKLPDAGPIGRLVHGGNGRRDAGWETGGKTRGDCRVLGILRLVLELLPGEEPGVPLVSTFPDMYWRGKDGGHAWIPGRGTGVGRGVFLIVVMVALMP